jgi:hypothetical protein
VDARLTTLLFIQIYFCEIQRSENLVQSGGILYGRLWLKKGCFASDDDYVNSWCVSFSFQFCFTPKIRGVGSLPSRCQQTLPLCLSETDQLLVCRLINLLSE